MFHSLKAAFRAQVEEESLRQPTKPRLSLESYPSTGFRPNSLTNLQLPPASD